MSTIRTGLLRIAQSNPGLRRHVARVLNHLGSRNGGGGGSNDGRKYAARQGIPFGESDKLFVGSRQSVAQFFEYMKQLREISDNLQAVVNASEAGRKSRSSAVTVQSYDWDGTNLNGVVLGTTNSYQTHLTLRGKWGVHCTCKDHELRRQRNRLEAGPCKHAYALGHRFWEAISEELEDIENALYELESACKLIK